ncbi:MAG: hypothetical protein IKH91_12240 [Prevotella sp.]|nr:hypothetical protein [Prevotella sp.]
MSTYIGLSLMAKRQEDAEKLASRASELLKELDPDDQRGVHFDQFLTPDKRERGIEFASCIGEKLELADKVIKGVVATFPEMKLRYYVTSEGPLVEACVSRDGKLVEIELWQTVLHLEKTDDYQRVLAYLQGNPEIEVVRSLYRHSPLSLGWEYDHLTEEALNDKRLQQLSEYFPDMIIKCLKYDITGEQYGDLGSSVAVATVRNGEFQWTNEFSQEIKELLLFFGCRNVKGIASYEEILFHSDQIPQSIKDEAHEDAQPHDRQSRVLKPGDDFDDLPF